MSFLDTNIEIAFRAHNHLLVNLNQTSMKERIQILNSFKNPIYGTKKNQRALHNFAVVVQLILVSFTILLVLSTISAELFEIGFPFEWEKMMFFVIATFFAFIQLPLLLLQRRIWEHRSFLEMHKSENESFLNELNNKLKGLIKETNSVSVLKGVNLGLGVFVVVVAMYIILFDRETYLSEYTKIALLLFYTLTIADFLIVYRRLTQNVKQAEQLIDP